MLRIAVRKRRADFALDVSIEVPTPGTIALFGRSGCGKTTLVNCIAGLLQADRAFVAIDDVVLEDTGANVRVPVEQRRIGYVFQDARLFPHMTVMANLRYGERRARIAQPFVDFDHVVALLGLRELLNRRPHELSGGEKQRVALGRALLSQPRLMLLDEPLAALDAPRREEVLPYLERLRDELQIPIVYVSHQFEEVLRLATHVVVMDRGAIATQGPIETVSRHSALRAIVGDEAMGAVLNGVIASCDPSTGLAAVQIGAGIVHTHLPDAVPGAHVRVQLLARDLILATHAVDGVSVRNMIAGTIVRIETEERGTELVEVDIGNGAIVVARLTRAASVALGLRLQMPIWVLVKAVSIQGHAFRVRAT
ncbi:MAG TPA: molybdenum ABC transporter ATP-binding protein [Steroidobacteraceae bacterium]